MRLWSLHPCYLDPRGLVALWREGLLARAVILGRTRGYRSHPALTRFLATVDPPVAIDCYLQAVADEAVARGYRFDRDKLGVPPRESRMCVTRGQLEFERDHLRSKLRRRAPALVEALEREGLARSHPMFEVRPGGVEVWERGVRSPAVTVPNSPTSITADRSVAPK